MSVARRPRVRVLSGEGSWEPSLGAWVLRGRLTAFRVSVDGTRVAVVVAAGNGPGCARRAVAGAGRAERRRVAGPGLPTHRADARRRPRCSWADASSLVVLGAQAGSVLEPTSGQCQSHGDRAVGARRLSRSRQVDGGAGAAGAGRHPRRRHLGRVRLGVGLHWSVDAIPPIPVELVVHSSRSDVGIVARVRPIVQAVHVWAPLVDLAVGRRCLDCGRLGVSWCDRCLHDVLDVHTPHHPGWSRCRGCDPLRRFGQLGSRQPQGARTPVAGAPARPVAGGRHVARSAPRSGQVPVALVPVPSTRAASRSRGHDHARRLARAAGSTIGVRVEPALQWGRGVQDQAGLSALRRLENVHGAMRAPSDRRCRGRRSGSSTT